MIRVLQINVGVCRAAQDLALASAAEKNIDVIAFSEQYRDRDEENGWYADASGRAAIVVLSSQHIQIIGPSQQGFRWIQLNGYRLYSCYCSPNVTLPVFEDFLSELEMSVRGSPCPTIITGDFNAKSREWGSPREDNRGKALADLSASLGLTVCNQGQPTFVRGASESHIDLTLVTRSATCWVDNWKVLDEESLSLHKYVNFNINTVGQRGQEPSARKGWAYRKLDQAKLTDALKRDVQSLAPTAAAACRQVVDWLTRACDASMPKSGKARRPPVPWWTADIAEQRARCHKARRIYTRLRKRTDDAGCEEQLVAFRSERKLLVIMIRAAKEENWMKLCELVDNDPWGLPYRIVMKKLNRRRTIPGLDLPGRLDSIVSTLFPTKPLFARDTLPVSQEDLDRACFSVNDVKAAARGLPNGKAPGPDGIPNEVMKTAVGLFPQTFAAVFNGCLRHAYYPPEWKTANLVLLRKPGKALESPSAYRPLCMLDSVGKLFEKLLTGRLREHLTKTGQAGNQFGFRPGKSTLDAMSRVRSAVQNANGRGQAYNLFVGMVTLDVKNAFNSAPWDKILDALARKNTPPYLINIIGQYLSERRIVVHAPDGSAKTADVTCGVPQGSVLGPDLWNVLYDDLLGIQLPTDVELIAFADDVALMATASVPFLLEERLEQALSDVTDWLTANGLELAIEKTEVILLTNRNKHNRMTVQFRGHHFESKKAVRYLGVTVDQRLHFKEHAELAAKRASDTCRQLTQILPNLRGPRQRTRKVLATVVTSRLLYGAPFWFPSITAEAMYMMEAVYRRVMLRVACCYRTASYDAATVVSGMPPLALLAEERQKIHGGILKSVARDQLMNRWQTAWNNSAKGRWTYRLITELAPWLNRKHGEVSFHLSQVLTGHGCFGEYLHRFGKAASDRCALCGVAPDGAEHAVFQCDAFHQWRVEACVYLDVDQLLPENLTSIMLRSNADWQRVSTLIGRIMITREREERARQQAAGGGQ